MYSHKIEIAEMQRTAKALNEEFIEEIRSIRREARRTLVTVRKELKLAEELGEEEEDLAWELQKNKWDLEEIINNCDDVIFSVNNLC